MGSLGCCMFSSWCSCSCRTVPCVISASKLEANRSPTVMLKVSRLSAPVQNLQDLQHCELCCNLLRFAENTACFGGSMCPEQQLIREASILFRCISKQRRADLNQSSLTKHASARALCTLRLWYWCRSWRLRHGAGRETTRSTQQACW